MLTAFLVTLLVSIGAASLTYLYEDNAPLLVRLANGVAVGTTLLGFVGYLLALAFGLASWTVLVSAFLLLSPALVFAFPGPKQRLRRDLSRLHPKHSRRLFTRSRRFLTVTTILAIALLYVLFKGVAEVRTDGIYTNNHHNLGDLPWHFAIVQGFAVGENFPPQHVEFAGTRLTYPFLVDFIAAQYVACGASLTQAFLLQNVTLGVAMVVLLQNWAFRITKRVGVAALVPFAVLFSGGWGFVRAWQDYQASGLPLLNFLNHLPRDYTNADIGYKWANATTTLFLTQRGLLLAVPIALVILTILWKAHLLPRDNATNRRLVWAGALLGLIPLVHGHTFLSLILVSATLALIQLAQGAKTRANFVLWVRRWFGFYFPALVLTLPQARQLSQGSGVKAGSFVGWQPGWEAPAMNENFVRFWLKNTGPLIPLLIIALLYGAFSARQRYAPTSPALRGYYAAFALCFIVPSLFRLAPWAWDNMKVFLYWFLPTVTVALTVPV